MLRFLSSPQALRDIKRKGAEVIECGIHDMLMFKKIISSKN